MNSVQVHESFEFDMSLDLTLIEQPGDFPLIANLVIESAVCGYMKIFASKNQEVQENLVLADNDYLLSRSFPATQKARVPKRQMTVVSNNASTKPIKKKFQNQRPEVSSMASLIQNPKVDVSSLRRVLVDSSTQEKIFQCTFCSYETKFPSTIKRHIEMKHLPKSVTLNCMQCTSTFAMKQSLKQHYMNVHGLSAPAAKAMLPI